MKRRNSKVDNWVRDLGYDKRYHTDKWHKRNYRRVMHNWKFINIHHPSFVKTSVKKKGL